MNGIKTDLIESCSQPVVCDECQERLKAERVANDLITQTQSEIKKIRKELYYRLMDFIKHHPLWFLIISSIFAIFLNVIASLIYDCIRHHQ
jgi:hypothetical protein